MPFTKAQEQLLEELFAVGAVLIGSDVHARFGLNSPIFFNLRESLHRDPKLLWSVGREFALKIAEFAGTEAPPQCVVGIPDSATPLAVATALFASQNSLRPEMCCAVLRKESKRYPGMAATRWIGPTDDRCEYNLIDDVVASGATKRAAAEKMLQEGVPLRRIVVLFDREQGDGLREEGFDLRSIFTASDALGFYLQRGLISRSDYTRIKEFLAAHRFSPATARSFC